VRGMRASFHWEEENMKSEYTFLTLRDRPELMDRAAAWFHEKWRVPKEAYLECMTAYLNRETEYGWYLCLDGERIVGGLGVIENDFHDRKDLTPNVCAVYTEADCRCQGIAGRLLNMAVDDMKAKGISPLYGILEGHRGQGYATEAVQAACHWAFLHPNVRSLEAETDAENAASQRVLEKCGFRPNGTFGEEGPRFSLAPMEVKTNILAEETFTELYSSVGWEPPCQEQIHIALQNSLATFTALEDGRPVGMVRLIGDGGMSFYIKDFAVHPDYQAKGVGKLLLNALEQFIRDSIEPGWAVSLELISTKEALPFYRKMGFEERPCEWDGPGMMKMLR